MTTPPDRRNFFDLLDLDPQLELGSSPWEPAGRAAYERELTDKRAKWARQHDIPGDKGAEALKYHAMADKGEIQAVMEDSAKRHVEAEDCVAGHQGALTDLNRALDRWREGHTSVTIRQVKNWAHNYGLTEQVVTDEAAAKGLTVAAAGGAGPQATRNRTSAQIMATIRTQFETLRRLDPANAAKAKYETLYTFLTLIPENNLQPLYALPADLETTPVEELHAAAATLNGYLVHNMNKTQELNARIGLSGQALNIFASRESREAYDDALKAEPLERLLDGMERQTGGAAPDSTHIKDYMQAALAAGATEDDARDELEMRAASHKDWPAFTIGTFRRCPFCDNLVPQSATVCPECARFLTLTCPNCGQTGVDAGATACPRCAFKTGNYDLVARLLEDAVKAMASQDYATAARQASDARLLWNPRNSDDLVARIESVEQRLAAHQQDLDSARANQLLSRARTELDGGKSAVAEKTLDEAQALGAAPQRLKELRTQLVGVMLNEAENAITSEDYDAARTKLDAVKARPAATDDPAIAARVADLEAKLAPHDEKIREQREKERKAREERQAEYDRAIEAIERSIQAKNLKTAGRRLDNLGLARQQDARVIALRALVTPGLKKAAEWVELARGVITEEERVELCLKALADCTDYTDAENLLMQSSPNPVTGVTAVVTSDPNRADDHPQVTITWGESREPEATYYLLRKVGGPPQAYNDTSADMLERRSSARTHVDQFPPGGGEVYYAVFVKRARVERYSTPALPASGPVLLAPPVTGVTAEPGDGAVNLSWQAGKGATVEIRRKTGENPTDPTDGYHVNLTGDNVTTDSGLKNGTTYHYTIFCIYTSHTGPTSVRSAGVSVNVTPHAAPSAPPKLTITHQQRPGTSYYDVRLAWGNGASSGKRVVYRLYGGKESLEQRLSTGGNPRRLSVDEMKRYFSNRLDIQEGHAEEVIFHPDIVAYAPAFVVADWVYPGEPQEHTVTPSLEEVEARGVAGALHVSWRWPAQVNRVFIVPGKQFPKAPLTDPTVKSVVRQPGQEYGECDVPVSQGAQGFATLAPVVDQPQMEDGQSAGGRSITGKPETVEGRATAMAALEFEVIPPVHGFGRQHHPYRLRLRVREAGPLREIPALVVRYKAGSAPTSASDGDPWDELTPQGLPPRGHGEIPSLAPLRDPGPGPAEKRYAGVFFKDAAWSRQANITGASLDKTRL